MRLLKQLNIWSIDVALAAGLLTIAFARSWEIVLPLSIPLLLAISVWLIYAFDHIKDAIDTKAPGLSERRTLHRKYVKRLLITSIILLLTGAVLVFIVPEQVVVLGTALSLLVAAYYLALHFTGSGIAMNKEMVIALLYTAGIVLGPLSVGEPPRGYFIQIIQLFVFALNNLLLFSWFDRDIDEKEGFASVVHLFDKERMRQLLIMLAASQVLLSVTLALIGFFPVFQSVWALISVCIMIPVLRPGFWQYRYRYRILGDLLFFVPSIIILST